MIYLGLDLGQAADPSALAAVEKVKRQNGVDEYNRPVFESYYHGRHIQRFALNTPYPEIVKRVKDMTETQQLAGQSLVIADATGVGRPVTDMLVEARIPTIPVVITAGGKETYDKDTGAWHVAKKILASNLQVLFQTGKLLFANGLPELDALVKEILNFKVKVSASGNDTYEAWRKGDHDDMVLALAMAAWYAERFGTSDKRRQQAQINPWTKIKGF